MAPVAVVVAENTYVNNQTMIKLEPVVPEDMDAGVPFVATRETPGGCAPRVGKTYHRSKNNDTQIHINYVMLMAAKAMTAELATSSEGVKTASAGASALSSFAEIEFVPPPRPLGLLRSDVQCVSQVVNS